MLRRLTLAIFFLLTISLRASAASHDWTWWARRLSLGDEARTESLAHLKSDPKIEVRLRTALRTKDKYLALDVIAALHLRALLNDLLNEAADDDFGYFYLAIDSLLEPADSEKFAPIYERRLRKPGTAGSTRIVILDSLSRMSARLPPDELHELLDDPLPELRASALSYLRVFILEEHDRAYLKLLQSLLLERELNTRLKLQALYLVSELSTSELVSLGQMKDVCAKSYPGKIQSVCRRLARE